MNLLICEDVENFLSDLSLTAHIFNEPCTIISKLFRLLRSKFETTQRNLYFKKHILEGCLSPPSLKCLITHRQIHVLKLPSSFGSFAPGFCCFLLVK